MATINVEICRKNKCSQFQKSADSTRYLCLYIKPFQFQFELKKKYEEQEVPKNCRFKDKH